MMVRLSSRLVATGVAGAIVAASFARAALVDDPELPPAAGRSVDLAADVRPILLARCVECHGPEKQKSGLRLDQKGPALAGGDSGKAIEPGHSADSELILRAVSDDETERMPPKGDPLTAEQIGILRAWIDQGATWPDGLELAADGATATPKHWAFVAPTRPDSPAVKGAEWVRNPIDAFILANLEAKGVAPSPEADRSTLLRRLSFDLTGLPPTPTEVDAFLKDDSPDAYERLVDRLLASPHYGERWGRHWLDLARYADSDGYEKDLPRKDAYRYRDWVIDALNRDLPFDQFTIQQLAGDLLPDATLEHKAATGFHRNTLTNTEGGVDQEEYRVAAVIDRVNTTGTVWLGLTVGCAQCHTHKFDPILQREYYSLFAFYNSGKEVDIDAPTPEELKSYDEARAKFDAEHQTFLDAIAADDRDQRPGRQAEWESSAAARPSNWLALAPIDLKSANGSTLTRQSDGSILVTGDNPATETLTIVADTELANITAIRVEALDDPSLPSKGPGRAGHGNFVLSELTVTAAMLCDPSESNPIALASPTADFSQNDWAVDGAIDGNPATGWAVSPQFGRRHVAVFETKDDLGSDCGTRLTITLGQQYGQQHTLGRFRLSAIAAPRPVVADGMPDDVAAILATAAESRSDEQRNRLADYHRSIDPEQKRLRNAAAEHEKGAPKKPDSKLRVLVENPEPRTTRILMRGDFLRPGDEVSAGTPGFLPALASSSPTRLDLANWLVDGSNPLTARVTVNRVWGHLFGRPLVASVEDFGTRGEKPTHPELIDWLATEYPRIGWSQKALIRTIVTSSTYRQSSMARPELVEVDANNLWLARQNRRRLEAEVLRDNALSVSGLLVPKVGGPSVRPPQPAGIADLTYAGSAKWVDSQGDDRYRRGLYTWFQRTSPYPMLMAFDAPDANTCAARRERSNTPIQSLTLLNDPAFVECAQSLARRIQTDGGTDLDDRIAHAMRILVARPPSPAESAILKDLFTALRDQAAAAPEAAAKLAGDNRPEGADPAEAAAWVAVARSLLNLDEFVTRE